MSIHARIAFDTWHDLTRGHFLAIYRQSTYYPPLFHVAAAPIAVFGGHPDSFAVANWLFLLSTMWAAWLIGRQLFGEYAGLTAGILVPACIYIAWLCVQPMTDLCLTACVCWTMWALIRTPSLEGKQAHLVGILIGLGMLAKWTYPFFSAVPIFIYMIRSYRATSRQAFFRRLVIVLAWAIAIAGLWYIRALPDFVKKLGPQLSGEVAATEGDPSVLSIASLTQYFVYLGKFYFHVPLALFVIAGLIYPAAKRRVFSSKPNMVILFSSIASGLFILTLIANKDPRYMMPIVPLIIVVSAGVMNRKSAVAAAIALTFVMTGWNLFIYHRPMRASTGVEEIADWLIWQRSEKKHVQAVVIPNEWTLNSSALNYALHRRDSKSGARRIGKNDSIRADYVITLNPPNRNTGISPREQEATLAIAQNAGWTIRKTFKRHDGKIIEVRVRNEKQQIERKDLSNER